MMGQWLWIVAIYAEPVVVNHGVLCWASGCESSCATLRQWYRIMVSYDEPVVVNRDVLYWASGCDSWSVMLSQWLWIMVSYGKHMYIFKRYETEHKIGTSPITNMPVNFLHRYWLPFTLTWIHPLFGGVCVAHLFRFWTCVLFVFVQCLVPK